MLMFRVNGTDMIFLEICRIDRDPIVFEVIIRGRTCVMKLIKASAEPRIGLYQCLLSPQLGTLEYSKQKNQS
jgi:hypothetical protein